MSMPWPSMPMANLLKTIVFILVLPVLILVLVLFILLTPATKD